MEQKKKLIQKEVIKQRAHESARKLKNEFNKAINTAILAAFGFLIALVWKDVITEIVDKLAEYSPVSGKIISALIITFICVLGIIVVSKVFRFEKGD